MSGTSSPDATRSGRSWLERIGNPLHWPPIDKALIIQGIVLPGMIGSFVRARYLMGHPEIEPYYDRGTLQIVTSIILGFLVVSGGLTLVGFHLRKRDGPHRLYLHTLNQSWWLTFAVQAYLHGLATTPLWLFFPVLGFFCLLLFDPWFTVAGAGSALAVVYATTIAERYGLIPYAPVFREMPFIDGRVAHDWLWSSMVWPPGLSVVLFVVFAFILQRARRHAARVAEMTDILKQMFGRYMSTEVMKTLLKEPGSFAVSGERRRVTIVFTDLRGFTALAERIPPEEVITLLNAYFEVIIDVCLSYEGTINEILGDGLLVTFGAPKPMTDHAAAAVACAIAMQNAMREVNAANVRDGRPELHMGIGVHTTEVIFGNIGSQKRSTFTVVGSGVNLTSRIESFAVGGQVLISQSVVDEAGSILRIDDSREVHAKGATAPLMIYTVGGIAGRYNLALEASDAELVAPTRQLVVRYVLMAGKHAGACDYEATVERLSRTGMELTAAPLVDLLDDVRLKLARGSARLTSLDVYAKVVGVDPSGRVRLRFTGTPTEVLTYFEGLLAT